jgi:hypothetical protein
MIVAMADTPDVIMGDGSTEAPTGWVVTVVEDGQARTFVAPVGSATWLDLQTLALSAPTLETLGRLS